MTQRLNSQKTPTMRRFHLRWRLVLIALAPVLISVLSTITPPAAVFARQGLLVIFPMNILDRAAGNDNADPGERDLHRGTYYAVASGGSFRRHEKIRP